MLAETHHPAPRNGMTPAEMEAHIDRVVQKYKEHVNPGLGRLLQFGGFGDLEEQAEGCLLRTFSGAEYIDFVGGYGVFSVGHRHPHVVAAVRRQLDRIPLSTRTFFNATQVELAETLARISPGDLQYAFFSNSGTEAVEAALKMARVASGKPGVVSTIGGFHGKTMGSLSATGREKYRRPFDPLVPGFSHVPFDDIAALEAAIRPDTGAVILEAIQGEGGIVVPKPGYLAGVRRLCDERGILLIVDEVQTALGRTGRMFAVEHESVVPDIMTLAKALGGGVMPIGATLAGPDVWAKMFCENPLLHTSTFGGNPLACAAAIAAIEVIESEELVARAAEMGSCLLTGLQEVQREHPGVLCDVRGRGLMIGVEFTVPDAAELTINGMTRRGVLAAYTLNNPCVIRFEPPLVISSEHLQRGLQAFRESVAETAALLEGLDVE